MFFWELSLSLSLFFNDSTDVGHLISGSSAFSKSSLNTWKFMVHVLLKPCLENFQHYFASVWDECNCPVVWALFGIAFLWDWNEIWSYWFLFPSVFLYLCLLPNISFLEPCLSCPDLPPFTISSLDLSFPGVASGKEPTYQCRRHKRHRSIPGLGSSSGGGHDSPPMTTHSNILAWRIPWREEPHRPWSIVSQSQTWLKLFSTHWASLALKLVESCSCHERDLRCYLINQLWISICVYWICQGFAIPRP